jgi:Peptidase A4 family
VVEDREFVDARCALPSFYIAPPGAKLDGETVEWILEAPNGGVPKTVLPQFSRVRFTNARGYGRDESAIANPKSGRSVNISYAGRSYTTVDLDVDMVAIEGGSPAVA